MQRESGQVDLPRRRGERSATVPKANSTAAASAHATPGQELRRAPCAPPSSSVTPATQKAGARMRPMAGRRPAPATPGSSPRSASCRPGGQAEEVPGGRTGGQKVVKAVTVLSGLAGSGPLKELGRTGGSLETKGRSLNAANDVWRSNHIKLQVQLTASGSAGEELRSQISQAQALVCGVIDEDARGGVPCARAALAPTRQRGLGGIA